MHGMTPEHAATEMQSLPIPGPFHGFCPSSSLSPVWGEDKSQCQNRSVFLEFPPMPKIPIFAR